MIKLRAQQIIIDVPRYESEPWILIRVQKVQTEANGVEHIVDRWGAVNKKLSEAALDVTDYFEITPVESNQLSVFALADAIKNVSVDWIIEKYGGTLNANGEIIL